MPTLVAEFVSTLSGFRGNATLWKVSPPMETDAWDPDGTRRVLEFSHVVVSAVEDYIHGFGVRETYIFGADETGKVLNWLELPGSTKGIVSPDKIFSKLGYTIISH